MNNDRYPIERTPWQLKILNTQFISLFYVFLIDQFEDMSILRAQNESRIEQRKRESIDRSSSARVDDNPLVGKKKKKVKKKTNKIKKNIKLRPIQQNSHTDHMNE